MSDTITRVLLIGQTPPPYGGQAMTLASLAHGRYQRIRMFHVRMAFSRSLSEIGSFHIRKLFHFIAILFRSVWTMLRVRPHVIHYPPSNGSSRMPFVRDVLLLCTLRTLFPRTKYVFSFNAAGLSEHLAKHPELLRRTCGWFVRRAFFEVDCAVVLSRFNPPDGDFLRARKTVIIPNGLRDESDGRLKVREGKANILYIGVLRPDKGIDDLLLAAAILRRRGLDFRVQCVGEFVSAFYQSHVERFLRDNDLLDVVAFPGVLTGDSKRNMLINADVFVYPTYADFESFGRVVVEAMMFHLPVVATRWRGVQDVVQNDVTGILVQPRNPDELAAALEQLLENPAQRTSMGATGRARYLSVYNEELMLQRYEALYIETARESD